MLRISAPLRADMFVRWLLPTKNKTKQKMACDVFDAFATYSSLVHNVSDTDCDSLAQNGSTHSRVFETLKLYIFKKPDVKIEFCSYCWFFILVFLLMELSFWETLCRKNFRCWSQCGYFGVTLKAFKVECSSRWAVRIKEHAQIFCHPCLTFWHRVNFFCSSVCATSRSLLPCQRYLVVGTEIPGVRVLEEGDRLCLSLHCHHYSDSCITMGSDESHFNVSGKVTRRFPQTTS